MQLSNIYSLNKCVLTLQKQTGTYRGRPTQPCFLCLWNPLKSLWIHVVSSKDLHQVPSGHPDLLKQQHEPSDTALLQLQWTVQTITRDRIYRRKYWQNFHLFNKNQTSISTHLYSLPEEAAVQLFPRTETCQYWGGWCALHRMMWTAAAGTCAGSNSQPRPPV